MKKILPLLLIAAGFLGLTAFRKLNAAEKLSFVLRKISFKAESVLRIKIFLVLGVRNPTGETLNLKSVIGRLFLNNNPVANVHSLSLQPISPHNETLLNVTIEPSLIMAVQEIFAVLNKGIRGKLLFEFRGTIVVNDIPIPVRLDYATFNTK